jgi:MFS family permease
MPRIMQKNKELSKQPRLLPWIIWGLSVTFYFYTFLLQVSPSVMVHDLMHDFAIDATSLNYLAFIYFLVYASIQIPVGILADRFNSRYLLTFAATVCGIGCLIFGTTHLFVALLLGRMLIALGSAFAVVCCFNLAAEWFPIKRFALLTGMAITIGMLGAIGGTAPLAWMIHYLHWRNTMIILAIIGIMLSICNYLIISDKPKPHKLPHDPVFKSLKYILCSKQNWYTSLYGGLMYTPTLVLGTLWGIPFLMHVYKINKAEAGGLVSFLFIGWIIGAPLLGWLSDFIARRKLPMIIGAIGLLITTFCIIYMPPHLAKLMLMLFLLLFGFFSSCLLMIFSVIREINPTKHRATALGFANMLNMLICVPIYPIIGIILDTYNHNTISAGAHAFSTTSYHLALAAIPIVIILAIILLPFIRETYCITND